MTGSIALSGAVAKAQATATEKAETNTETGTELQSEGQDVTRHWVAIFQKTAYPFQIFIMVLIGLGNSVNPLLSLCDPDVYSIPMLLLIGWRGEPGVHDEPQHIKQGKVQLDLFKAMDIPYEIISKDDYQFGLKVANAVNIAKNKNPPVVLLIKKGTFEKFNNENQHSDIQGLNREEALEIILDNLNDNAIIISTTGKTSREIFEIREKRKESHEKDFLTVGSMGHCSSIALGIAIAKPDRKVVCIDGDGALIMHMGSLSTVGKLKPKNFYHILMNNQMHESVGGQKTSARFIDFKKLVQANAYNKVLFADDEDELVYLVGKFMNETGPSFLELKIEPGFRGDLGRPTGSLIKNKEDFMGFVQDI